MVLIVKKYCLIKMRTLGKNMAFLMKSIQLGKQEMGLPEKERSIYTNFHH